MKQKLIFSIIFLIAGCAVNTGGPDLHPDAKKSVLNDAPDWISVTPEKDGYDYTTSQATSQDAQLAIDKATLDAKTKMAANKQSEMNGYEKRVVEETGLEDDSEILDQFSKTQESIVAYQLEDVRIAKQKVVIERTDNGRKIYRAYVLLEYNQGAADEKLLKQIEKNQVLYDKIRATDLFDEMESKVDAYRKRMEEKTQQ